MSSNVTSLRTFPPFVIHCYLHTCVYTYSSRIDTPLHIYFTRYINKPIMIERVSMSRRNEINDPYDNTL